MDMQSAIEAPRFRLMDLEHEVGWEQRFDIGTMERLSQWGHKLSPHPEWAERFGGVEGIQVCGEDGSILGGYDPRRNSMACGF